MLQTTYRERDGRKPSGENKLTKVTKASNDRLCEAFHIMALSRELDLQMNNLIKQGKGAFHVGAAGHEAAQLAISFHLIKGHDWLFPYYRDLTFCLNMGFTPEEIFLDFFGKEESPSSKGRQMACHWGKKPSRIVSQSACTGTQYLQAVGAAMGCKRRGKREIVFVSSGEGATSQGDFHEALNWAAREILPIIFLIEDNNYAISVPKSEQTAGKSIAKIAAGYEGLNVLESDGTDFAKAHNAYGKIVSLCRNGKPCLIQSNVVRLLGHSSSDDHLKYKSPAEIKKDQTRDCLHILEEQLISKKILSKKEVADIYRDVKKEASDAADAAWEKSNPKAEDVLRDVYCNVPLAITFEIEGKVGEPVVMIDAINHALDEELAANPSLLIYGEDVAGGKGGVFSATRALTAKYGNQRVFNSQLAESAIVGTAIGLALTGFKPVVEIQFSDYIFTAFMQIRNELAHMHYRSGGEWTCPVVIRAPTGGYIAGGLYHSQNIEAFFSHIPGIFIAYPATAADAKGLLKTACRMNNPVLFLEHKYLYRQGFAKSPEPQADYFLPFGKAKTVKNGTDATIITYGALVQRSMEAATAAEKATSASIEVIDLRTIIPYDKETILQSVRKTGKALIVHEDTLTQGFGAELSAFIAEHAFEWLDAPVTRIAGTDTPVPFHNALETAALPDEKKIQSALKKILAY